MKAAKLRELTNEELAQREADWRRELYHLKVRRPAGQVEQPSRLRMLRRDIARALTILRERRGGKKA